MVSSPETTIASPDWVAEVHAETLRRYPDAGPALAFFLGAVGLATRPPDPEDMAWAEREIARIEREQANRGR